MELIYYWINKSFASKYIQKLIKEITECSSLDRENYNIYKQKIEYMVSIEKYSY